MRHPKSILVIAVMTLLTGCGTNVVNDNAITYPNIKSVESNGTDIKGGSDGYGSDTINNVVDYQYDSGIYAEDVNLADKYDYKIRDLSKPEQDMSTEEASENTDALESTSENTQITILDRVQSIENIDDIGIDELAELINLIDTRVEEINTELNSYIDENGNIVEIEQPKEDGIETTEINYVTNKEKVERLTAELDILLTNRAIFENKHAELSDTMMQQIKMQDEQLQQRFITWIKSDIYENGIYRLYGYRSVQSFANSNPGQDTMQNVLNRFKESLENLEYFNNYVDTKYADNKEITSNWIKVCDYIDSWKEKVSSIDTAEEYIEANLKLAEDEKETVDSFVLMLSQSAGGTK